ncbi:ferric reductase-like transmembrane domain-containing protein [Frankia sp. Cppng1_Ct_nod]|uniref:ferric reductase-like transmembrane domain-containing protein n=1 Tax=Frankia sp. Cppng1_Ct_nod TaxID=2897162 RepID=UPI001041AD2D|nr:ferric reductase-like transmembrane domain-containing protein [Frankia sp. Cppng1_Ct_nod]
MNTITSSTALWYTSRATGIISLVMLSAVVVLGVLVNRKGRLPGLPRFAVTGLHRTLSLLVVIYLALHILTAVADPYVSIRLIAAIVPFTSSYETFWLGLGAISLDLIITVVVTSLLRLRLGHRVWRGVHWLAYAAYPVALVHGIGASSDLRSGWLLALTVCCACAVCAAIGHRLAEAGHALPRPQRVAAVLSAFRAPAVTADRRTPAASHRKAPSR